jgi:hypothetical protein
MHASPSHTPEYPRVAHARMRAQIERRMPRPGADRRLAVTARARAAELDDRSVDYTRLSGAREDVLDYAAFLFATDTGWGDTALSLVAIEEDGETLTLLLGKPLEES